MTPRTALVLGGTQFVGRHLVHALLDSGWAVTLFCRGRTNPDLFPQAPRLIGDRQSDVSALTGGRWDVVFDVSAYHPDDVSRVADALQSGCGHYVLVSSVSAYADVSEPGVTEDAPLAVIDGRSPRSTTRRCTGRSRRCANRWPRRVSPPRR